MTHDYRWPLDMSRMRIRHVLAMTDTAKDPAAYQAAFVGVMSELAGFDVADLTLDEFDAFVIEANEQIAAFYATRTGQRMALPAAFLDVLDGMESEDVS